MPAVSALFRAFAGVEHASDVFVERRGTVRERFVGGAFAGGIAALAALPALLVFLEAPGAA